MANIMVGWCWNKEKQLTEVILTWLELWSVLGRTRIIYILYIDSCP